MLVCGHFAGRADCLAVGLLAKDFQELGLLTVEETFLSESKLLLFEVAHGLGQLFLAAAHFFLELGILQLQGLHGGGASMKLGLQAAVFIVESPGLVHSHGLGMLELLDLVAALGKLVAELLDLGNLCRDSLLGSLELQANPFVRLDLGRQL